jgi:NADH:ubiquinone oxidoreductase subunit 3 (subunit A)
VLAPLGAVLAVFVATVGVALSLRALGDVGGATASERLPYAGGYPPRVHAWSRFHARYYVMALVFLAFDMEMVYMYPWAVVFVREGAIAIFEMGWFIVVLLLGILYTWRERAFEWA